MGILSFIRIILIINEIDIIRFGRSLARNAVFHKHAKISDAFRVRIPNHSTHLCRVFLYLRLIIYCLKDNNVHQGSSLALSALSGCAIIRLFN
jgi:hypothetical protein